MLPNKSKKVPNQNVFYNISQLDEAISNKKKVSFIYLKYDGSKKLVPRRENKYSVNPYGMVCLNEHYLLDLCRRRFYRACIVPYR